MRLVSSTVVLLETKQSSRVSLGQNVVRTKSLYFSYGYMLHFLKKITQFVTRIIWARL